MRTITIEIADGNDFTVREGSRYADRLCWDEMLGQIAQMTHPNLGDPRYAMLTEEEHAEKNRQWLEAAAKSVCLVNAEVEQT